MVDIICQTIIVFTGFTSMYLLSSQDARTRMWAGLVGLFGEPFWLITAVINGQWGVIILVVIYGINWFRIFWFNYNAQKEEKNYGA
jgi:hypothetical protein